MSNFEDEVEELIGVRPDGWTYHGDQGLKTDADVFFAHTPGEDEPQGQPINGEQLRLLMEAYGIEHIQSISSGATGSRIVVRLGDIL